MEKIVSPAPEDESKMCSTDDEKFATVSSSIMLNLPTSKLDRLREVFESNPNLENDHKCGLSLNQYLVTLIECMSIRNENALIDCVADLIDFFDYVDLNGDGYMDWDEFVTFIIEQCSFAQENKIMEKFASKHEISFGFLGAKSQTRCTKYVNVFEMILQAVGPEIHFLGLDLEAESWTTCSFTMPLFDRNRTAGDDDTPINAVDITYWNSTDTLIILRSDFCLEFCQFLSRSKLCLENLINRSVVSLSKSFVKIAIREESNINHTRLFAVGPMNDIYSWELRIDEKYGQIGLFNELLLMKHSDFVNDVIVVKNDLHEFVVSGSLDRYVNLWDLCSLEYKSSKTGHTAGIQCLAFDGHSIVVSGGFDHKIIGWDLDNVLDIPAWELEGHEASILKIIAFNNPGRCFSLDESGELKYWLSSIYSEGNGKLRLIDSIPVVPNDRLRSFDVFPNAGIVFDSLHGIVVCAMGRKQYLYTVKDTAVQIGSPKLIFFSRSVDIIICLHCKDIIFRHAINADVIMHIHQDCNDIEYTTGTLTPGGKKFLTGTSRGIVSIFKSLNGAHLRDIDVSSSSIMKLSYLYCKNIVVVDGDNDLMVIDEELALCLRSCTRSFVSEVRLFDVSQSLGMIVTYDTDGILNFFDYEFCVLISSVGKIADNVSRIIFMETFGCLLMKTRTSFFLFFFKNKQLDHAIQVDIYVQSVECNKLDLIPAPERQIESYNEISGYHEMGEANLFSLNQMRRFIEFPREVTYVDFAIFEADENSARVDQTSDNDMRIQEHIHDKAPVFVCCGSDDGVISIYDFTRILREFEMVGVEGDSNFDTCFDTKRLGKKKITPSEIERKTIPFDHLVSTDSMNLCVQLMMAWKAHRETINCLCVVGHHNDVLSCSEDRAIYLWEIKSGILKGVLTHGQDIDRHITPKWKSMVDEDIQERSRKLRAEGYIRDLSLKHLSDRTQSISSELDESSLHSLKDTIVTASSTVKDEQYMNDRDKVIGQLAGKVTYQMSDKDVALSIREGITKKKVTSRGNQKLGKKLRETSDKYFDSCSMSTDFSNTLGGDSLLKTRHRMSAYDFELLQVQNSDPNNWEITSKNRQRAMYSNLYDEYSKGGRNGHNQLKVLEAKANALSPQGDFQAFYSTIVDASVKRSQKKK